MIQALYAAPQDTIRVLLEQSLSTVSAREYEVYLALGSLEAPHSTPELLTYLLERPSEEIERALWELTGRGLLTREAHPGADAVTYRMHDLTWRVAREHRTHLPHHLRATTLQYAAAHTDRADLLAADLSHLLAAASSAPPDELKTLMAFWLGGNYIAARGFPAAQLHLLDSAITAAEQTGDWDAASLLNGKYADISQALLGDQSAAIARLQRGAKQAEYCGQLERQAVQLSLAGQMGAASDLPEAAAWLETASALAGASGNPAVQARVWGQQAITEARQQNFIEAQRLLERAAAALEMYLAGTGKPEEDAAASPQQKAQQKAQQGSGVDSVLSRSG